MYARARAWQVREADLYVHFVNGMCNGIDVCLWSVSIKSLFPCSNFASVFVLLIALFSGICRASPSKWPTALHLQCNVYFTREMFVIATESEASQLE